MYYINSTNGVKIAVYDSNAQCKETVFLVHGWPLSHKIFEYQMEPLLNCNYRVISIDLRGFGNSDVPSCSYSYDQMAQDIYNVVCGLKLRSFTLVGFSMGGAIALRYMRKFRGQGVKKLLLLAAAAPCWTQRPGYPYGQTKEYANQLIYLASTDRPKLCENFSHQLFASQQSEAVTNWFGDVALSASGIGTVQAGISLRDEDGRADLGFVQVPTWIIHGAKDQIVSSDLANIQHESIENSKLITLENSGHGVMYDELELFNTYFIGAIKE